MGLFSTLFGGAGNNNECAEMLKNGAVVIDVRSPGEFQAGHPDGAKNYPLQSIQKHISEIKAMNKEVVLCCASGNRSGMATSVLKKAGVACVNGGAWTSVQRAIEQGQSIK